VLADLATALWPWPILRPAAKPYAGRRNSKPAAIQQRFDVLNARME
jgi:hypothetical protein